MIQAKIVADSINDKGDRLTSMLITLPRILLSELNTHRMLSKNSASSRAIPFKKMVESVKTNPFIPSHWMKDHSGMQGSEYITNQEDIDKCISTHLAARDLAVEFAKTQNRNGVTKQLCNRYLEPFMWHTVLISGTEWENFFSLRCPQYQMWDKKEIYRSRKDAIKSIITDGNRIVAEKWDYLKWAEFNKGQAEIHMMALAEAMWDAMNDSRPEKLMPGDWHIPFKDKINIEGIEGTYKKYYSSGYNPDNPTPDEYYFKALEEISVKISTAMAARTSYTVVGDEKEISYDKLIEIHDKMANQVPFHASPFEHCAQAMDSDEYEMYIKGEGTIRDFIKGFRNNKNGWCRNYRGFIQYRHKIEKV